MPGCLVTPARVPRLCVNICHISSSSSRARVLLVLLSRYTASATHHPESQWMLHLTWPRVIDIPHHPAPCPSLCTVLEHVWWQRRKLGIVFLLCWVFCAGHIWATSWSYQPSISVISALINGQQLSTICTLVTGPDAADCAP